VVKEGRQS